jgi:hypothetical protein
MTSDEFVNLAKKDPLFAERKIISFITTENSRAEQMDITPRYSWQFLEGNHVAFGNERCFS